MGRESGGKAEWELSLERGEGSLGWTSRAILGLIPSERQGVPCGEHCSPHGPILTFQRRNMLSSCCKRQQM